jgi:hypothetical protein
MADSRLVTRNDSPNVRRADKPGAIDAFSNLRSTQQDSLPSASYKLTELLSDRRLIGILLSSNIFVFGKVGFLDIVFEALKASYKKRGKKSLETVRTLVEISKLTKDNTSEPFILIPAAKNKEAVSEIVATAFETKRPIWLGALPSQIEKQILLSFDCFFISPGPKSEIDYLGDLVGLKDEHRDIICNQNTAILTVDHEFPKINKGKSDSPGKIFYVKDLT